MWSPTPVTVTLALALAQMRVKIVSVVTPVLPPACVRSKSLCQPVGVSGVPAAVELSLDSQKMN